MQLFTQNLGGRLLPVLLSATVALLVALGVGLWRATLLRRLGARNIARRRTRAALIVAGLMLSSTVIGCALTTGDTISHTMRGLVISSLGNIDEVVIHNLRRTSLIERIRTATMPGYNTLAAVSTDYFPLADAAPILAAAHNSETVAGVAPAIINTGTLVDTASRRLQSGLPILAIAPSYPAVFGTLHDGSGQDVSLANVGEDEIILNRAAADLFEATPGRAFTVIRGDRSWDVRLHTVVSNGALGGTQPLLIVPLKHYQRAMTYGDYVNQILIANHGGEASIQQSSSATRELRVALADERSAQALYAVLQRPEIQRGLRTAAGIASVAARARINALLQASEQPEMTDEFISQVSDPRTRQQLIGLARNIDDVPVRISTFAHLGRLQTLSVIEIKKEALDRATNYGAVISTVFLLLGIFSIAAAVLLIFLIFALLAADRTAELATMRALGMRRTQIMGMFLIEASIYALGGALLGSITSLIAGTLLLRATADALAPVGIILNQYVEPRSLLVALCGGLLLSTGAMVIAAWRASHGEIVAGTRGEDTGSGTGSTILGIGLLIAAGVIWWRWHRPPLLYIPQNPLVVPAAWSCALTGIVCLTAPRLRARPQLARSLTASAGLAVSIAWLVTLLRLPAQRIDTNMTALTIGIGGMVLVLAAVITVAQVLGPALRLLDRSLFAFPRLRAIVRPAAGYLGWQRWRSGLTVIMFALIMTIMIATLTLIDAVASAYGGAEAPIAGFDIRSDWPTAAQPVAIDEELAQAATIARTSFRAIGGIAMMETTAVRIGSAQSAWQPAPLVIGDDGFFTGIQAGFDWHAPQYGDAAAVWAAVRDRPGTAILTARTARALGGTAGPFILWVNSTENGRPIRLDVVGVVAGRSALDEGIYVARPTAVGLKTKLPASSAFFFAVQTGVRIEDATEGLRLAFAPRGVEVIDLSDTLRIIQSMRLLLVQLVQNFMGLGLLAGSTAVGILGIQAVIERRRQLGTLRALGFPRTYLGATLVVESAIIAITGIVLGLALGLTLAHSLIGVLAVDYPELRFAIPWADIRLTLLVAAGGSGLAILLITLYASRIAPADALRGEL